MGFGTGDRSPVKEGTVRDVIDDQNYLIKGKERQKSKGENIFSTFLQETFADRMRWEVLRWN